MARQGRVFPGNNKPVEPTPVAPAAPAEETGRKGKTFPGLRTKPRPIPPVEAGRRGQVFESNAPAKPAAPKPVVKPEPAKPQAPAEVGRKGRVFNDQKPAEPKKTAKTSPLSKEPVARIPTGQARGAVAYRYWKLSSTSKAKGNWAYHEIGFATEHPFVNNIALAESGVTADSNSDNGGNNEAVHAIDGEHSTHWSTNVLKDHSQAWWSCDFGRQQACRSLRLVIGPYWPGTSSLDVHGSDDGESWTLVKSITGMNPANYGAVLTFQLQ